jgi:hypothetical protein
MSRNINLTSADAHGNFAPKIVQDFYDFPVTVVCGNHHKDFLADMMASNEPQRGLVFVADSGATLRLPDQQAPSCLVYYLYAMPKHLSLAQGPGWERAMMSSPAPHKPGDDAPQVIHKLYDTFGCTMLVWGLCVEADQIKRWAVALDQGYKTAFAAFR